MTLRRSIPWLLGAVVLALAYAALTALPGRAQDTGWTIDRFHADIQINPDASIQITEAIDVDFDGLDKHGIFREIPVKYSWNDTYDRVYKLTVLSVTDTSGTRWPYSRGQNGANVELKIGDANKTVSGKQSYRITYTVQGALNAFADHDELYWNVNGADWTVPTLDTSATVHLPGGGFQDATCYLGHTGSTALCDVQQTADTIEYRAPKAFQPGQQLTIVVSVRKGAIAEPVPILEKRPRDPSRWFETTNPLTVGLTGLVLVGGLAFLASNWWTHGRDRHYTTIHYLTDNPEEETRPLFRRDQVVVEFQPPEKLRPAQMGLLLDERADTKDVTATIVDLAVRGYLTIEELPKHGIFGHKDWKLTRTTKAADDLQGYESIVLNGLFEDGDEVEISALKNHFYVPLGKAQKALYADATRQKWFNANPDTARHLWRGIGIGVIVLGGLLTAGLGFFFGAALIGLPVILAGLLLLFTAGTMPQRTARGSELLRRILGFRRYITTAETDRQRFNEQANIFAEYLPYAIVFGAVEKWARAFRDVDVSQATSGWYVGSTAFNAALFSSNLSSFNSSIGTSIASTPGGSGGSGFGGGGFSGGGGGGGGGGSW